MIELITTAFILGIAGSMHCVGMCGTIVLATGSFNDSLTVSMLKRLFYNLGRTTTYTLLGLLFGLIGLGISLGKYQQQLSIIIGSLMLLTAIFQLKLPLKYFENISIKISHWLKSKFQKLLKSKSLITQLSLGFFNGLLPCGLVYVALAGATSTADPIKAAVFMAFFGLGTIPALFLLGIITSYITDRTKKYFQEVIPLMIILFSLLLILRGLNLDIPYLSPKFSNNSTDLQKVKCH